jgi:hypothetical protein
MADQGPANLVGWDAQGADLAPGNAQGLRQQDALGDRPRNEAPHGIIPQGPQAAGAVAKQQMPAQAPRLDAAGLARQGAEAAAQRQLPAAQRIVQGPAGREEFQAPICHYSFASLFADPTQDPNHAEAFNVINNFDPNAAAPITAAALKQAIIGTPTPNAFLCCSVIHGTTSRVYVIHSLSRFPMSLTGRASRWDNCIIGFLGDVIEDIALNVIIPDELFDETPNTLVYNPDAFAQAYPDLDIAGLFPRIKANAANQADTIWSRYFMFLPNRFVSLVLDNKGYTPKRIYKILIGNSLDVGCMG